MHVNSEKGDSLLRIDIFGYIQVVFYYGQEVLYFYDILPCVLCSVLCPLIASNSNNHLVEAP